MKRFLEHLPFLADGGSSDAGPILGLMVSSQALHAVLLERDETGTRVVRRFSRQRSSDYSGGPEPGVPANVPDFEDENEDFSIQFGDGAGGSGNLFLGSEFGDLSKAAGPGSGGLMGGATAVPSFALELSDILDECRDAGYEAPRVAFCLPAAEVVQMEMHVPDAKAKAKKPKVSQKKLFALLKDQYDGVIEQDHVAFLPMTATEEEVPRYLALVAPPTNPVTATLQAMREQKERRLPAARLLETEVPLYLGLARAALRREGGSAEARRAASEEETPDEQASGNTLIVRTGAEDTLVLFLKGNTLHHAENLPSLTALDAPETVCSRVLLLQDEYGIGEVERVFLIGEEQEEELVESFEMFFPDAKVEPLRRQLPGEEEVDNVPSSAFVPAAATALRLSDHAGFQTFEDVNLMPKGLLRRQFKMPVSWHVPALYLLLFGVTIFFVARYFSLENEISDVETRLKQYPEAVSSTPRAVQARIDSLQAVSARYTRGLDLLDALLMGSDQWSQALAQISNETAAVQGLWIESWAPRDGQVEITGNATSRDRVVRLAERIGGTIQQVSFSEIRDWPVYSFIMTMPLETGLPQATRYLREQATASSEAPDDAGEEAGPPAAPASLNEN